MTTLVPMGHTRGRILLAVLAGHAAGRHPSLRELCRETGRQMYCVQEHLVALRKAGLVVWDRGEDGRVMCRTLRPACRFLPAGELFESAGCGE
jgi:predicted transcriptional regulator